MQIWKKNTNKEEELEQEIERLKKQKNLLLDELDRVKGEMTELDQIKAQSDDVLNHLEVQLKVNMLTLLGKLFFDISNADGIIPYKKIAKNAEENFRIKKDVFDCSLQGVAEGCNNGNLPSLDDLMDFMKAMGIFKVQSGKYYRVEQIEGQAVKTILIKKSAYEYFIMKYRENHLK